MDADVTTAQKLAARKAAFAARKAVFGAEDASGRAAAANAHLSAVLAGFAGHVLAGYMPMRTEISPLAAMHGHQGALCVPVITAPATPLCFAAYHEGAEMTEGAFGAFIPADLDYVTPTVLIVPLLAYDGRGFRLGYGGGFYDRTLEGLRAAGKVTAIGFAFAGQEMGEVPIDGNDQPLDMIVTENGCLTF